MISTHKNCFWRGTDALIQRYRSPAERERCGIWYHVRGIKQLESPAMTKIVSVAALSALLMGAGGLATPNAAHAWGWGYRGCGWGYASCYCPGYAYYPYYGYRSYAYYPYYGYRSYAYYPRYYGYRRWRW